jgi:hypothetical protein
LSAIWTPIAVASEAKTERHRLWRAVEAQHLIATRLLVDSADEQALLERIIDGVKPAAPKEAGDRGLHYLLLTPWRYAPPPPGTRFRAPTDEGVFYGADAIRTACAELGWWRWKFLLESPALERIDWRQQTLFSTAVQTLTIDLRQPPFDRDAADWTAPDSYVATQAFARVAREAEIGAIRYASVRDPAKSGGVCTAVLRLDAFAGAPDEHGAQSWAIAVQRERVIWRRQSPFSKEEFVFEMKAAA